MKIVHEFNGKRIERDNRADNFILSNNIGGYVSFSNTPVSKHQGLVFYDGLEHFEVIDNLQVPKKITKIINRFTEVEREYEDGTKDKLIMPHGRNSLIYKISKKQRIELILDCRKVDDMREFGRYYEVFEENGVLLIKFIKTTDSREDKTNDQEEFHLYLAIKPDSLDYSKVGEWFEEKYSYDERRIFLPEPRYVYHAVDLNCSELICAFGTTKTDVLLELKKTIDSKDEDSWKWKKDLLSKHFRKVGSSEKGFASLCAMNSLLDLRNDATYNGIYAGLYWFRQFWSRDELISIKAFIEMGEFDFVKQVLFRWLNLIGEDGRLPNRFPASHLGSADSIGWLFKRLDDFIFALEKHNQLEKYLPYDDLIFAKNKAETAVYALLKYHSDGAFIKNEGNETWMDTAVQANVPREGVMLEIQALQLCIYRTMNHLCNLTNDRMGARLADGFEKELIAEVRDEFWAGSYLKDGINDPSIRPNIFIVCDVYPELLSKTEWMTCFDTVLPKLWCDWGGLSSLDKTHPAFQKHHLGEGSVSYHQGDSWFWINNLAASGLSKVAPLRYRKYIRAIKQSSINEILWSGIPGHHAEISSATNLESLGCFSQAWSAATLFCLLKK